MRRSPLALLAVVVLASGSTTAAVALLIMRSAALTGTVPGQLGRLRYDIPLAPDLEPGHAGWCSYPLFSITGSIDDAGAGTCSPAFLLNARAPRRPAPAPPGLMPTNQPDVFTVASAEILAKRVGVGWLLVQSRSITLARMLLDAIRVDGTAVAPDRSH
jgi:hypothetical protein